MTSSTIRSERYLAQLLLKQQERGNFSPSQSASRKQHPFWPLENNLDSDPSELLLSSPTSQLTCSGTSFLNRVSPPPDAATNSDDYSHRCDTEGSDYRFYSALDDDAFFQQYALKNKDKPNKKSNESFPIKLYRIIHETEKNGDGHILSFSPSGLSVMIHKPEEFVKKIMPKYFTSSRLSSFQRQLNLYGFRRRMGAEDKGGFYHPDFIKNCRNRCLSIKRKVQSLKIPPHLLENSLASPRQTHPNQQPPALVSPNGLSTEDSPSVNPASLRRIAIEETPSFRHSLLMSGADRLSRLGFVNGLGHGSSISSTFAASELLELKWRIATEKQRAALKKRLALSALQEIIQNM